MKHQPGNKKQNPMQIVGSYAERYICGKFVTTGEKNLTEYFTSSDCHMQKLEWISMVNTYNLK